MNQDNNFNQNNFNSQGNNGMSNNQSLNNLGFNQNTNVNQQIAPSFQQPVQSQDTFNSQEVNTQPNYQQSIDTKLPKKSKLGLIIGIVAIVVVVTVGVILLSNNKNEDGNTLNSDTTNSKLSIVDTLPIEKSFNHLNWFYTVDDMTDVWNVNVDFISNKIQSYTNTYKNYNSKTLYSMHLTGLINNNLNNINIKFDVENKDTYKQNQEYIVSYYSDFKYYEDEYKDYDIITSNYDNMIRLYKEVGPSYYFTILITKNVMTDDLENYKEYYQNLVDTVIIKKLNKNEFKNTSYLTLYPMGWHSNGGGHFYLNSKKVKIDNMTFDFEGYSVANVNSGFVWKEAWKNHYDYAITMMKDTPEHIDGSDSYFSFGIIYVSNKKDDTVIKDYFVQNNYEISNKKINGYNFVYYKDTVEYNDYFMYETNDGYYLFDFGSRSYYEKYSTGFNAIFN